ncbi:hypothetical protein [Colwellia sp. E2M01]|uniref:hypothetical protein n=1 Tax=Colwellia sp. E2M01 TaxID=2841561 RepID=UPI001C094338|nr:hypothetical protein [Colwellia sp. E2M01]MBU2871367.1 hypothetical protein [Colwellia sp. E2M01]
MKFINQYIFQIILSSIIALVLLFDIFTGVFSNSNFVEGVWVEFHGFLIEAVLIIVLLNYWTKRQEAKKIKPVMDMIISKADKVDGWITLCFEAVISNEANSIAKTRQYADITGEHLKKFNTIVDLNSPILGADYLPMLVKLIELMDEVKLKIQFLSLFEDKASKKYDFIILNPLEELFEMRDLIEDLGNKFKFERSSGRANLPTKEKLNLLLESFTKSHSIYTDVNTYKQKKKTPYFFDVSAYKKQKNELIVGSSIKVFKQN